MGKKPTYEELTQRIKALEKTVADYKWADELMGKRTKQIDQFQMALLKLAKEDYKDLASALEKITKMDADTLGVERASVWFFNEDRSETIALEQRLTLKLTPEIHFTGFADRSGRTAKGRLFVVDYKTSKSIGATVKPLRPLSLPGSSPMIKP